MEPDLFSSWIVQSTIIFVLLPLSHRLLNCFLMVFLLFICSDMEDKVKVQGRNCLHFLTKNWSRRVWFPFFLKYIFLYFLFTSTFFVKIIFTQTKTFSFSFNLTFSSIYCSKFKFDELCRLLSNVPHSYFSWNIPPFYSKFTIFMKDHNFQMNGHIQKLYTGPSWFSLWFQFQKWSP